MDKVDKQILAEEKARSRIEARMHERAPGTIRELFKLFGTLNGALRAHPEILRMDDVMQSMTAVVDCFEAFEDKVSLGSSSELWAGHDVKPRDGA